jgi:hypothetical protein
MSKDAIIAALRQASILPNLNPPSSNLAGFSDLTPDRIHPLISALEAASELRGLWGKWVYTPDSGSAVTAASTGAYLADRARCGASPHSLADSLFAFAADGEADLVLVRALLNVIVDRRVDIGPGVYLLPPERLPTGVPRDVAFAIGIGNENSGRTAPGRSALVAEVRYRALGEAMPRDLANVTGPMFDPAVQEELNRRFDRARLAMIASGGASPAFGASYAFIRNPGWPAQSSPSVGAASTVGPGPVAIGTSHSASMQATFAKAQGADGTLTLALGRLAASRSRTHDEERAIDLGTALEILLMHGTKAENAEITNKISQRGAWLIGANGDDRLAVANVIKQAYGLRSKAVHGGHLPAPKNMNDHLARQEAFRQTEDVISRLVDRLFEGWPDWNRLTLDVAAAEYASKA